MRLANRVIEVSGKGIAVEWARELAKDRKDLIRMETADSNFDPPAHIIEAAKQAIERKDFRYPDFRGLLKLREAISDYLEAETRVCYDPLSEILVTNGAAEAIYIAIQGLVNPGDEIILPDPTYLTFEPCVMLAGGKIKRVPLIEENGWRMNLEVLEEKISTRTKVIILTSPNNPTGTVFTKEELERIAELACKKDLFVIFDVVFNKIVYDEVKMEYIVSFPEMKRRAVLIGGFSKVYSMSGFRVGWLASESEFVAKLANTLHLYTSICANTIAQEAAIAALRGPQDWLSERIRAYKERRDLLVQNLNLLPGIKCQLPQGGFFVFPDISAIEEDAYKFAQELVEKVGIVVTPGPDYGPRGRGHIRIVFGAVSMQEIEEALKRLETYITYILSK